MGQAEQPLPVVGILSIGDMGAGIARLLVAKGFTVVSNCTGRSEDTLTRAREAGVQLLPDDITLVRTADIMLSIVPPRDARATAERIIAALDSRLAGSQPLYYADLNAISPSTVKSIASLFPSSAALFVDGAIIGAPPHLQPSSEWSSPQIPTSGPHPLPAALATALASQHINNDIGAASGLKMCFASLTKGYTAIAVQSYATAERLGVLDDLVRAVDKGLPAGVGERITKGMVGMCPKAYRWVGEMDEIARTHEEAGWIASDGTEDMFSGAAGIYRLVAEGTVLGREKVGRRERGVDVADVAKAVGDGLARRKEKME